MEDNKLVLLAMQQTLDENTEVLKKILNKKAPTTSNNTEEINLDLEPLEALLNTQFDAFNSFVAQTLKEKIATPEEIKPTVINKNYSLIGSTGKTLIKWNRLIYFTITLLFLTVVSWLGFHYWFTEGYKVKDQMSAYKTILLIDFKSKKKYSKKEILQIYNKYQKDSLDFNISNADINNSINTNQKKKTK